jgi:polar amino acid transport system substrate-binding protein
MPAFARLSCPLLLCVCLAACDGLPRHYPEDPQGTLERVHGGTMRVGVAHDPPFVLLAGEPQGPEADLIRAYARSVDARIAWNRSGHDVLMRELEGHRLDAVIGGHAKDSPWSKRVSTSRPFRVPDAEGREVERVLALPPGENAWQMRFERFALSPAARRALGTAP